MRGARSFALTLTGVALFFWACKDYVTNPGGAQRQARQVRLDSAQFTIPDGDTLRLHATVLDQNDSAFAGLPPDVTFAWASTDTAVVRVDSAGLVTGVGPGSAHVTGTVTTALGAFGASAAGTVVQPLARLVAVSGGGQTDSIGATLPESLTVQALDSQGRPVAGIQLQFAATHGLLSAGTAVTNAGGIAQIAWMLGVRAGADTVRASTPDLPDSVVVFATRVTAGAPDSLVKVSGDAQTGQAGTSLPSALVVRVADRAGNPVAGDSVAWSPSPSDGTVIPAGVADTAGRASGAWTLGPGAGAQTVTVTSAASVPPVTFTATATAGAPASIAVNAGNNQTGTAATGLPISPSVSVKDSYGNPVPGVAVTFAVTGGGGSVTGPNQTTGTTGIATVGTWILGSTPGTNTLTATAAGAGIAGNPVIFTATGTPGAGGGGILVWVGSDPGGPDWNNAANWTPNRVPTANDTVEIGTAAHSPVLSASGTAALIVATADSLNLNGHTLIVGDSVSVRGGGMLIMRSASDSLLVGGTLTMGGGDETGKLTAGVITVGGDFNQPPASSSSAFVSTGTHRVVMLGTRAQQMTFTYGLGVSSHFNDLEIQGTSPLFLAGRTPVTGNVTVLGARPITGNDSLIVSGNVTTAAGSSLSLPGLEVGGALAVAGSYAVDVTNFTGSGQTIPVLTYATLAVSKGPAATAGPISASGGVFVVNLGSLSLGGRLSADSAVVSRGTLTLGGHTLAVTKSFTVTGSGALVETNVLDSVVAHGDVTFGGGDETGNLTAGVLAVDGNFNQPPAFSALAWVASPGHKTVLTGLAHQTVSINYINNAHFGDLEVDGSSIITMATRVPVAGSLTITNNGLVQGTDTIAVSGDVTQASPQNVLSIPGLEVGGALVANGEYGVGMTNFTGTNQVVSTDVQGFQSVAITGTGATTGGTAPQLGVGGNLLIEGSGSLTLTVPLVVVQHTIVTGGSLTLGGHLMAMGDSLRVGGSGVIVMTNAADTLVANGNVVWGGGDETGKLTAGVLAISNGNFTQPGAFSASSFATSGTFKTFFNNSTPTVLTMTYAGGNASRFNDLDVTGALGGVVLQSDIPVNGILADTLSTQLPTAFTGNGHTLSVNGIVMKGATLDHVLLRVSGPRVALDTVTFQNYAPGDTQLGIIGVGSYSLTGLGFLSTPTTGFYLSADGAGLNLTVQSNLAPAQGAAFTRLLNGATVTWQ